MSTTAPIFSDPAYTGSSSTATTKKNELGKDDFLKLMIAQLQNQDPLNPLKDNEFIAQMASFSSLEQMNNLNKTMESILKYQQLQSSSVAVSLIGKEIATINDVKGVVSAVTMDENGTYLKVGDKTVPISDVKEIKEVAAQPSQTQTS